MAEPVVGRFAPTPSGRLHPGNVLCAMLAWLSARSQGGRAVLRIEDIDKARCSDDAAAQLIDDLRWLGFDWDGGEAPAAYQSRRTAVYTAAFEQLQNTGLLYPCYCSRAELHAAAAPHLSDGNVRYDGHCRRYLAGVETPPCRPPAWRLTVPDTAVTFTDGVQGDYRAVLSRDVGDFLVRRSDGVFAYQLAVVTDDAASGVTEVVRGSDLLSSTPAQLYLYALLGFSAPQFYHIPLLLRADGTRLSKRDGALDMGAVRERFASPAPLLGMLAYNAGLLASYAPVTLQQLLPLFDWKKVPREDIRLQTCGLF